MQILLTQEEYLKLISKKTLAEVVGKDALQKFCTKVADELPIRYWGREEKTPWGCIKTIAEAEHYCDECPSQEICPSKMKKWSK